MPLTLTDLSLDNEGNYSCVAESEVGVGINSTMLDVTDPPPYIHPPTNVTVAPGSQAILSCVMESAVDYDIKWYRVSTHSGT